MKQMNSHYAFLKPQNPKIQLDVNSFQQVLLYKKKLTVDL